MRTVGAPVGGWFDKQGKFHVTHAELANRLNRQVARAWAALDFLRSAAFMSAIADFAQNNEKFQSSVSDAKDNLHDLLDELDWDGFTLRIKHEEGDAAYKALVDGHDFHSETAERQKRLQQAKKAAKERLAETKQRSRSSVRTPTHRLPFQSLPSNSTMSSARHHSSSPPVPPAGGPRATRSCCKCNGVVDLARDRPVQQ